MYYKLDENKKAVPCELQEWSDMFEDFEMRRVMNTEVDGYDVSTVFLGLDHGHGLSKNPLLFETMIFGEGSGDGYQTRCSTWEQALEMHQLAIDWIKNGCLDD